MQNLDSLVTTQPNVMDITASFPSDTKTVSLPLTEEVQHDPVTFLPLLPSLDDTSYTKTATFPQFVAQTVLHQDALLPDILLSILDGTTSAIYAKDSAGRYILINPAAALVFQTPGNELLGKTDAELEFSVFPVEIVRQDTEVTTNTVTLSQEISLSIRGDKRMFFHIRYPLRTLSGEICGLVGILRNITRLVQTRHDREEAYQAVQESAIQLMGIVEGLNEGILITDRDDIIVFVNQRMAELTGYTMQELLNRSAYDVLLPESLSKNARPYTRDWTQPFSEQYETFLRGKGERQFWAMVNAASYHGPDNRILGTLSAISDNTKRREAEEKLRWQATHDPLTKLPNRNLFCDFLEQAIATARKQDDMIAVFLLDLNRFKEINDLFGHAVGDSLLVQMAQRLQNVLPENVTLARWIGDKFAVLIPHLSNGTEANLLAQQILEVLTRPFVWQAEEMLLSMNIGIALFPMDGNTGAELLRSADMAMSRAHEEGNWNPRGGYQRFNERMNREAQERMVLQNTLRHAIERQEFVLYYQPLLHAQSGRLAGVEALIRWKHPEAGLVGPDRFIRLAEETGLIVPIGHWVISAVCQQMAAWRDAGIVPFPVGINLSARQFREPGLATTILCELEKYNILPQQIHVELTETVLMKQEQTLPVLEALRQKGVQIVLDDFGIGYSSLAYLRRLPLDVVKIDRAFVRDLADNETDRAIVRAVIDLAHALKMETVAEGVETAPQMQCLRDMGCSLLQGFRIGRPVPAESLPLHQF